MSSSRPVHSIRQPCALTSRTEVSPVGTLGRELKRLILLTSKAFSVTMVSFIWQTFICFRKNLPKSIWQTTAATCWQTMPQAVGHIEGCAVGERQLQTKKQPATMVKLLNVWSICVLGPNITWQSAVELKFRLPMQWTVFGDCLLTGCRFTDVGQRFRIQGARTRSRCVRRMTCGYDVYKASDDSTRPHLDRLERKQAITSND